MNRKNYMKLANRRFLEGTRYKAPIQAVEAGVRTLEEWTDVLNQEREAQSDRLHELVQYKILGNAKSHKSL